MNYDKALLILKEKEVFPNMRFPKHSFIRYGWNKIRVHQTKRETMPHFIAKAIVGKLIMNKGDGMITEYEFPNCDVVDVLQIKGNELIGYQIETGNYKEKSFEQTDVITIPLNKMPEDIKECFNKLKNYFLKYVV